MGVTMTVRGLTRSTLQSTAMLTRKTGSTLKSNIKLTLQFLGGRKHHPGNRHGRGFNMTLLFPRPENKKRRSRPPASPPAGTEFTRDPAARDIEPVTAGNQIIRLATSANELDAAQALRYR